MVVRREVCKDKDGGTVWWLNVMCVRIKRTMAGNMAKARTVQEERARRNEKQNKRARSEKRVESGRKTGTETKKKEKEGQEDLGRIVCVLMHTHTEARCPHQVSSSVVHSSY